MLQAISTKSKECYASDTSATFLQQHPPSLPLSFFLSFSCLYICVCALSLTLCSVSYLYFCYLTVQPTGSSLNSDIAFVNLPIDISTHLALGIVGSPEVAVPPLCPSPAP